MSEINDLRERVEAAEERFGLMDEQQRHYSERVIGLIETIEAQLADARGEIEKQIAENQRLGQENEELRTMLHSVLRSIEEKTFTQTLQNLEARVSALVGHAGATEAVAQDAAADSAAAPEAEPDIAAMVEEENSDPAAATDDAGIDVETAADEGDSDEAVTVESEMPETVAFEDADPEEIAAEAEAEAADGLPEALAEGGLEEAAAQLADAPGAEPAEADAPSEVAESASDDEVPAESEMESNPPTSVGDEGEDIFAAMNLLNADNEDFAAAAQDTVPVEDDVSVHEAAAAEGDFAVPEMAAPEAPEFQEEAAAEDDAFAGPENELSDAVAERLADEVPEDLADSVAPTVKEIIRRVGDLARELERAETARRSAHSGDDVDEAAGDPAPAAAEGDDHPEMGHAANG